jgi:hypothetical protein
LIPRFSVQRSPTAVLNDSPSAFAQASRVERPLLRPPRQPPDRLAVADEGLRNDDVVVEARLRRVEVVAEEVADLHHLGRDARQQGVALHGDDRLRPELRARLPVGLADRDLGRDSTGVGPVEVEHLLLAVVAARARAEIDEEAWSSLYSDTSRPFEKPKSGRIAVKVINHLGDEVMKLFSV